MSVMAVTLVCDEKKVKGSFRTGPAAGSSHRRIMVDVRAESMVGGTTFHRK
jgi:hypothetical protein